MSENIKALKHNRLLHKKKSGGKEKYLLIYTCLFSLVAFAVLLDFFRNGYTLLRSGDAFFQHYKALMYFAQYVREIIKNILFEHRFVIPQWDFEVGLGSDIITTFAYYSFGDPFNYLSFLVPTKYMHLYYQFMVVFRLYCAGLSFSYFCFKTQKKNIYAILTGSLTYCFSAWAIFSVLKHPYFVNPMIFLPLIILGVEKIMKGESFLLFTFTVALSVISNFYFFYIIVLLTVIYTAVRFISVYKTDIKAMLRPFFKIFACSLLGVGIGAVLFLPVVVAFLGDSRSSAEQSTDLFFSLRSYLNLPISFFTFTQPSSWLYPCVSVLFIPCTSVMLAQKRKNTHIKVLLAISVIMMCSPIFGRIFNGFSYPCSRWCFGYVFVAAYIITDNWDELLKAKKKYVIAVCIGLVTLSAVSLIMRPNALNKAAASLVLFAVIIFLIILIGIRKGKTNKTAIQIVLLCLTIISIIVYSDQKISPSKGNYVSEFTSQNFFEKRRYDSNIQISKASKAENDDDFMRFTGRKISQNASFLSNLKSTQYYYSLSNGNISDFRLDMNMPEYSPYCYLGFDSRTILNTLSSVKYFYNGDKNNKSIPYGYEKTDTRRVWKNNYALPFGYTYDEYITKNEYDSLSSSADKEWAMLNTVVLENDTEKIRHGEATESAVELDYKMKCVNKTVTQDGNKFIVTKKNSKINLYFKPVKNSETIVSLINMTYEGINPYDLYSDNRDVDPSGLYSFDNLSEDKRDRITSRAKTWKEDTRVYINIIGCDTEGITYSNEFYFYTPSASFFLGRSDFDINLGYTETGMKKVTVVFEEAGIYTFDGIKVIAQTMDGYEDKVAERKEDTLQNLLIDYNIITGDISLNESKLLCLSMPYSGGWTAYVNGEKTELLKVNGMYCGLMLEEGNNKIELRYQTPGLKYGAVISFVSILIFIFFFIKTQIRRKERMVYNDN